MRSRVNIIDFIFLASGEITINASFDLLYPSNIPLRHAAFSFAFAVPDVLAPHCDLYLSSACIFLLLSGKQ